VSEEKNYMCESHHPSVYRLGVLAVAALLLLPMAALAVDLPDAVEDSDFYKNGNFDENVAELGRLLFFDKILSGNKNISCATCHHPLTGTSDDLSLPVGEGGKGLGVDRTTGKGADKVHERVPRNAPHVFNLGAKEFKRMFHDGRVTRDKTQPSGFLSPAGNDLPQGLDNPLAVQAMFPVTSGTEMAGQGGENEVADAAAAGDLPLVWELLAQRLRETPGYVDLFVEAFPEINSAADIEYKHAANAIAEFEASVWRFDNSPFDRYLRGEKKALSRSAKRGMKKFYGSWGCSDCHSGAFQTDQRFHSVAMPQIGPGKGDGVDGREDFGRARETGLTADMYEFRTPTLRNVTESAPYTHAGAYNDLGAVILHHLDPAAAMSVYDPSQAVLPSRSDLDALDTVVQSDPARVAAIVATSELEPMSVKGLDKKLKEMIAFMEALTDPASLDMSGDVPDSVPSGLPVAD
jgi:cytochrome c peroxidase